jgi:multicomponent Na+:H+ antiporter subunit A
VFARYIAQPAVSAVINEPAILKLSLWHGFNPALALSLIAVVLGIILFGVWNILRFAGRKLEKLIPWGPESGYLKSIDLMNRVAVWQTKVLQNGQLRNYILVIVISSVTLLGSLLIFQGGIQWPNQLEPLGLYEASLAVLIVIAALAAVRSKSRLGAITAMGVVGYSVALIFLRYGAPDLAMTQFLIESITVVLFVFAFYHLPKYEPVSSVGTRIFQVGVATLTGLLMTGLVISVLQVDLFPSISNYFMENAVSMAHGRNIVNVILVDFRGLDTLGEITVLAVAATGVYAVLKYRRRKENR